MRVTHKGVAAAAMTLAIAASGLAAGPASAQPEFTSAASNLNRFQPTTADARTHRFRTWRLIRSFIRKSRGWPTTASPRGGSSPMGPALSGPCNPSIATHGSFYVPTDGLPPDYTPPSKSPYADIYAESMFYKEVCWVASEGISQATSAMTGRCCSGPPAPLPVMQWQRSCTASPDRLTTRRRRNPHSRTSCRTGSSTRKSVGLPLPGFRQVGPKTTAPKRIDPTNPSTAMRWPHLCIGSIMN